MGQKSEVENIVGWGSVVTGETGYSAPASDSRDWQATVAPTLAGIVEAEKGEAEADDEPEEDELTRVATVPEPVGKLVGIITVFGLAFSEGIVEDETVVDEDKCRGRSSFNLSLKGELEDTFSLDSPRKLLNPKLLRFLVASRSALAVDWE